MLLSIADKTALFNPDLISLSKGSIWKRESRVLQRYATGSYKIPSTVSHSMCHHCEALIFFLASNGTTVHRYLSRGRGKREKHESEDEAFLLYAAFALRIPTQGVSFVDKQGSFGN